jgi:Fic family protein
MKPPPLDGLLAEFFAKNHPQELAERLIDARPAPKGKYRHWDILRHLKPPKGLSHREWWLTIKMARRSLLRRIPLRDREGTQFSYCLPDVALAMLHDIDKRASGTITASEQVTNPQTRDTYLIRSLMEEAITSSQLEGAATTRKVAKEMLQTGRPPRTRDERMIRNNYEAMHLIRERKQAKLSSELILELHRTLTADTMPNPADVGRFRVAEDHVVVEDASGQVLHVPPDADELPGRIQALCDFVNQPRAGESFVHPVVHAILLHFWLAYDHPFVDGNGRTARALFYWSMAKDGYWLLEFTSISRVLRAAPSKYARAFLYSETDDNDATYFILNQLAVIIRAIDDLYAYLNRKAKEMADIRNLLGHSSKLRDLLNYRQLALLQHALRNPGHSYTIESHRKSHNVTYQTARTDLLALKKLRLLKAGKIGRTFVFDSPLDLQARISKL